MRSAATITAWPARPLPGWLPAAILIAVTALAGPQLGGAARPLFVLGSLAAGWYAGRCSPGAHLQAVLALFSFAPFLRRIVDLSAGFDPGGLMVAAPLLALLAPLPELRELTVPGRPPVKGLAPLFVFAACVLYCVLMTVAQGEMAQAISNGIKWFAPVIYAAALYRRAARRTRSSTMPPAPSRHPPNYRPLRHLPVYRSARMGPLLARTTPRSLRRAFPRPSKCALSAREHAPRPSPRSPPRGCCSSTCSAGLARAPRHGAGRAGAGAFAVPDGLDVAGGGLSVLPADARDEGASGRRHRLAGGAIAGGACVYAVRRCSRGPFRDIRQSLQRRQRAGAARRIRLSYGACPAAGFSASVSNPSTRAAQAPCRSMACSRFAGPAWASLWAWCASACCSTPSAAAMAPAFAERQPRKRGAGRASLAAGSCNCRWPASRRESLAFCSGPPLLWLFPCPRRGHSHEAPPPRKLLG